MATYNGHKNWNHWNVSLWFNNDEGLYSYAREAIRKCGSKDAAAKVIAQALDGETTPDGAPYSKSSIRAALVGM